MIVVPFVNAEPYNEMDFGGVQFAEVPALNHFGGADIPYLQVLESAAGFYIGDLCKADYQIPKVDTDFWEPYSRDSLDYWPTRKDAESALIKYRYARKF